jgi:hydrophobe/amphiphile efflux-1 (HAE1) family protein
MQWLARVCVQRPVFAGVLMLVIFVLGGVGYTRLGVDQLPSTDFPLVLITTTLPGAAPEEVESDVTDRIEGAVNTIDGIDELRSTSTEGFSQVAILFKLEKNGEVAAQDARDKVSNVVRDLPRGVEPPMVSKLDPQASPVLLVALQSTLPVREVTEIADKRVRRQIESVSGVGRVTLVGGRSRQIHVWLDPIKLRSYNLSALDVQRALASQNLSTPGGSLEAGPESVTVRINGRVEHVADLERLVVRAAGGAPVRVGDVARIEDGQEELASIATYDGERTVILSIQKQSGTNTVKVVDDVLRKLEDVRHMLPPGVRLEVIRDNAAPIRTGVGAVKEHLVVGALLAALVVLFFLGNLRSTLIAAVSIPISIVGTFALMWLQGFTLDMLTLLALALSVGIVIDDAIVVLENITRYIEEKGIKPFPAAVLATREIGLAVLATTLSLLAVFVPVAFVGGIIGRFLKAFGYTMAFSITVSLLVSFTLTPAMSARLLRPRSGDLEASLLSRVVDVLYRPIERAYMHLLTWCMRHRWVIVVASCLTLGSCGQLAKRIPKGFIPVDDQAQFQISLRMPEGTSADETALVAERVAQDVRRIRGVAHTVVTVAGGEDRTVNLANIYVGLTEPTSRQATQLDLMDEARRNVIGQLPKNLRVSVSEVPLFNAGVSAEEVQYVLVGPDLVKLRQYADEIGERIKRSPAVVDYGTNTIDGKPEERVEIERDRAADLGVSVADIAETLRMLVAGIKTSTYAEKGEEYDVRLRAEKRFRRDSSSISLMTVPSVKYGTVPLGAVVHVSNTTGPAQVDRLARQRQVTFMMNVAPGHGEGEVVQVIQDAYKAVHPPSEYRLVPTGRSKSSAEAGAGFAFAFALSFVFMYLVLAAQFDSWLNPVIIILSLPLTVPFGLLSLLLFNQSLNLMSALGLLVLFGVVKKNAILQVDHTDHLRSLGKERLQAILEANRDRLRPILMTTVAFVAGMVPLAFSRGIGSGMNRNISGIVIGGQAFSLLLTLLAIPVAYSLLDDVRQWRVRRAREADFDRGEGELEGVLREGRSPAE